MANRSRKAGLKSAAASSTSASANHRTLLAWLLSVNTAILPAVPAHSYAAFRRAMPGAGRPRSVPAGPRPLSPPPPDLGPGPLQVAVVVDDEVGAHDLLLDGHLRGHAGLGLLPAETVSGHEPLQLQLRVGVHHDDHVHQREAGLAFEQQRDFGDDGRPARRQVLNAASHHLANARMGDALQPAPPGLVREDDGAQPAAVQRAVRVQHLVAEGAANLLPRRLPGLD